MMFPETKLAQLQKQKAAENCKMCSVTSEFPDPETPQVERQLQSSARSLFQFLEGRDAKHLKITRTEKLAKTERFVKELPKSTKYKPHKTSFTYVIAVLQLGAKSHYIHWKRKPSGSYE